MRRTNSTHRSLLAVCVAAFPFCLSDAGRADELIRWKFLVGEKLSCNMTQEFSLLMNMGSGDQQNSTLDQVMDMTLDVQGVNQAGDAVIDVKFDRILAKISDPIPVEYDTSKDAPAEGKAATFAPLFKAMTQGEFEITMTARGEIKDVKVPQEVLEVLKNNQQAMGDLATPKGLQEAIMQWAFVLPKDAPKVGDRTTSNVGVNNPMGITVETTYTYDGEKEVDGNKYARFVPTVRMNVEGTPTMRFKVKDQKSDGEVLFNIDKGRIESMQRQENVSLEATVAGQTMPAEIVQTIHVKLTPK